MVERLTMTGPGTLMHELTYDDPETFTAPWTTRMEWTRDDSYKFYEYACHEGNEAMRGYITADRAERAAVARGEKTTESPAKDSRTRFTQAFDRDAGLPAPPPVAGAPATVEGRPATRPAGAGGAN